MPKLAYHLLGWNKPLRETIESISNLGYIGVEFFDLLRYINLIGGDLKKLLYDCGLTISATYVGASLVDPPFLDAEVDEFIRTVDCLAEHGARHVIVGCGRIRVGYESSDRRRLSETLNMLGAESIKRGVKLAVHPHFGTIVCTDAEIGEVMDHTSREFVGLCPDSAHLSQCGCSTSMLISKYRDRVDYVHLKDWDQDSGMYVELGTGSVPLKDFKKSLDAISFNGWYTVELDATPNDLQSAKTNTVYLRQELGY